MSITIIARVLVDCSVGPIFALLTFEEAVTSSTDYESESSLLRFLGIPFYSLSR